MTIPCERLPWATTTVMRTRRIPELAGLSKIIGGSQRAASRTAVSRRCEPPDKVRTNVGRHAVAQRK